MTLTIQENANLKGLTTMSVAASARELAEIHCVEDLTEAAVYLAEFSAEKYLILGGGSDILMLGDFDGLVLLNKIKGIQPCGEDKNYFYIRAGSAENWHNFVRQMLDAGKLGLENLALVPGTVGGAATQNIGAYGKEVAEFIESVECFDLRSMELQDLSCERCDFGYRTSIFKQPYNKRFITAVTFKFPKKWIPSVAYKDLAEELSRNSISDPTAEDIYSAVVAIRQRKLPDPKKLANAGSFFKNPIISKEACRRLQEEHPSAVVYPLSGGRFKVAAAWLIDQAGMKGQRVGDVGTYEKQPLVVVNYGDASGKEIYKFVRTIQQQVKERFDITLEPEVVIV